jgi:hypothetical protein
LTNQTLGLLLIEMKQPRAQEVASAASLMGKRSAEARIKNWGKREFLRRMREWGKLGGRPKSSGKKKGGKK